MKRNKKLYYINKMNMKLLQKKEACAGNIYYNF